METVLSDFQAILNAVNLKFWNSTTDYEKFIAHDDAESIIFYLRNAIEQERKQSELLRKNLALLEKAKREDGV
jgi:hypothetical protein